MQPILADSKEYILFLLLAKVFQLESPQDQQTRHMVLLVLNDEIIPDLIVLLLLVLV